MGISARVGATCRPQPLLYPTIEVDAMVSKSCMSTGMLEELSLEMPVASQRLTSAIRFALGNNSEATCREIAYLDMEFFFIKDTIKICRVSVFILPRTSGCDILFGISEQKAIGMATLQDLFASRSRVIRTDKSFQQAESAVIKIQRFKVMGDKADEEILEEESIIYRYASSSSSTAMSAETVAGDQEFKRCARYLNSLL